MIKRIRYCGAGGLAIAALFTVSQALSQQAANLTQGNSPLLEFLGDMPELPPEQKLTLIQSGTNISRHTSPNAISPNAEYIVIPKEHKGSYGNILQVASLESGRIICEIGEVRGKHHTAVPTQFSGDAILWSPDSVPYIRMAYVDVSGWGEWCEYDIKKKRFYRTARDRLDKMLSYDPSKRPVDADVETESIAPRPPVWAWSGKGSRLKSGHSVRVYNVYDNELAAYEAGVYHFWSPPTYSDHPGSDRKYLGIEQGPDRWTYNIFTSSSFKTDSGIRINRGHVFLTDWWSNTPESPNKHKRRMRQDLTSARYEAVLPMAAHRMPPNGLLLYEDGALVVYGSIRMSEAAWKVRLPGHRLKDYYVLPIDLGVPRHINNPLLPGPIGDPDNPHAIPPGDRLLLVTEKNVGGEKTIYYWLTDVMLFSKINVNLDQVGQIAAFRAIWSEPARRIVQGRPYHTVAELNKVEGIDAKALEYLRPIVSVSD